MALASVRDVELNYEIIGVQGPWLALSPGGRRGLEELKPLAHRMADAGYRVLLHDRRNCGLSSISFADEDSEFTVWADDLHTLMQQLGIPQAIIGGFSSGCRMSLLLALKYPSSVAALLLMRVTGGEFAARRLARKYYGAYIELAEQGGMVAVADEEHFAALLARNPQNRAQLTGMPVVEFVRIMKRWQASLEAGASMPALGISEAALCSLNMPVCIIPGNDATHPMSIGRDIQHLIKHSQLYEMGLVQQSADFIGMESWCGHDTLADTLIAYLKNTSK